MHTLLTDEEMIRQFLPNQPNQCFEALYNRYVNKVYRRCLSMTRDTEKAQDFTHDIFLRVFNKLDAFQERSSFSTWLYSIAYNYCSDQLRLAKRLPFDSLDDTTPYDIPESTAGQLHEETLQLVNQAIATLPKADQTLLRMKYEEGLTIEQIAQVYQINISAVKMRLKRSRDKVHRLYARQCGL
jgi:RNA polymerase sigma-70 factor (ECF subfamily)